MNIKEIKEIIEMMKENNITEFEIERDGLKIFLKRGIDGEVKQTIVEERPQSITTKEEIKAAHSAEEPKKENVTHVVSPMVGTFYAAPSPDSQPYVNIGDEVKENDVVCIIEAMKVMNEIKAETRGRVKDILVKNGDAVEFSQPIFVIERT